MNNQDYQRIIIPLVREFDKLRDQISDASRSATDAEAHMEAQHAEILNKIGQIALEALRTDGSHHKQWYLEKIIAITGMNVEYERSILDFDRGIAP